MERVFLGYLGIEHIVGQRPPTPPLDMLTEQQATALGFNPAHAGGWDGGLPRHALEGYDALSARSVSEPEWFWNALIEHFDLRFDAPYERVLDLDRGAQR